MVVGSIPERRMNYHFVILVIRQKALSSVTHMESLENYAVHG